MENTSDRHRAKRKLSTAAAVSATLRRKKKSEEKAVVAAVEGGEEREEVEGKIRALQRIVPGGESCVGVDKLFEETAGYIVTLQCQLKAMKTIATFFEALEDQNRKLGG